MEQGGSKSNRPQVGLRIVSCFSILRRHIRGREPTSKSQRKVSSSPCRRSDENCAVK